MADPIVAPSAPVSVPSPAESAAQTQTEMLNPTASTEATAPEATPAAAAKAVEKQLKKLKLKVDGKEEDFEFDPNDDEFMTRQLQMSKMGQKRAQEFSQLQKEVADFIQELKANPRKILSDPNIGIDIKKMAAEVIEEEIENSKKSPQQLEKEKLEAELQELKDQRQREKSENDKREFERLQAHEYERYDTLMTQALDKSDLPKTPYVVKKMADYMLLGLQNGVDVSPQDVLPLVRQEMQNDLKEMFAVMPDEVIEALVGKDVIGRIRKKSVAKAKQGTPPTPVSKAVKDVGQTSTTEEKKASTGKKTTFKDFFGV